MAPSYRSQLGSVVLPGDILMSSDENPSVEVFLGDGVTMRSGTIVATRAGFFCIDSTSVLSVESSNILESPIYTPQVGDVVIGIVKSTVSGSLASGGSGQRHLVDIGAAEKASLDVIAFDGATKRNKPKLGPGDAVFARVAAVAPGSGVELSCCVAKGSGIVTRDWTSGQAHFRPLLHGALGKVPIPFAKWLMRPAECAVLRRVGEAAAFDAAVGHNGLVWISALPPRDAAAKQQKHRGDKVSAPPDAAVRASELSLAVLDIVVRCSATHLLRQRSRLTAQLESSLEKLKASYNL